MAGTAMKARAIVETQTRRRRVKSPHDVNRHQGIRLVWDVRQPGTLSLRLRCCQLENARPVCAGERRLLGPFFTRSFVNARGNSSVGRAQPCQGWGRGFESRFPLRFSSESVSSDAAGASSSARVAKLVDARDLKSLGTNSHAGSIPAPSTE